MTEPIVIYVRFFTSAWCYKEGDIVKVKLLSRDPGNGGIQVHFGITPKHPNGFNAWNDMAYSPTFIEINAMELLAFAADGKVEL